VSPKKLIESHLKWRTAICQSEQCLRSTITYHDS